MSRAQVRRSRAALLGLVAGLSASAVVASPTFWERLAKPELRRGELLYRTFDAKRVPREEGLRDGPILQAFNRACAIQLRLSGAAAIEHPELSYLLADCLSNAEGTSPAVARDALLLALERAPDHPLAAAAWFRLGTVSEALDEPSRAYDAYREALLLETDADTRAAIYRARAQLSMGQQQLEQAIGDYRVAVAEARDPELWALSEWGLGVALDRHHDFPSAVTHLVAAHRARLGNNGRKSVLDLQAQVLWPPAEVHYYRALALLAEARTKGARDTTATLLASQLMWLRYLEEAPAGAPWRDRARGHLERIRAELPRDDDDIDPLLLEEIRDP